MSRSALESFLLTGVPYTREWSWTSKSRSPCLFAKCFPTYVYIYVQTDGLLTQIFAKLFCDSHHSRTIQVVLPGWPLQSAPGVFQSAGCSILSFDLQPCCPSSLLCMSSQQGSADEDQRPSKSEGNKNQKCTHMHEKTTMIMQSVKKLK